MPTCVKPAGVVIAAFGALSEKVSTIASPAWTPAGTNTSWLSTLLALLSAGRRDERDRRDLVVDGDRLGRRVGGAVVVGHGQRHDVRARHRVGVVGVRLGAGVAVTEVPGVRRDRAVTVRRTVTGERAVEVGARRADHGVRRLVRRGLLGEHRPGAPVDAVDARAAHDRPGAGHDRAVGPLDAVQRAVDLVGPVELVAGQEHAAHVRPVDAGHVAAGVERLQLLEPGADDVAAGGEVAHGQVRGARHRVVEPAVVVEHAGHLLHLGGELGEPVQVHVLRGTERGAVEGPLVEVAVGPRGVEVAVEQHRAAGLRPLDPGGQRRPARTRSSR